MYFINNAAPTNTIIPIIVIGEKLPPLPVDRYEEELDRYEEEEELLELDLFLPPLPPALAFNSLLEINKKMKRMQMENIFFIQLYFKAIYTRVLQLQNLNKKAP